MHPVVESIASIFAAIVGLAIVATLVSKNAKTSQVIGATTSGFASDLTAAEAPVTGGSSFGNLGSLGDFNYGFGT